MATIVLVRHGVTEATGERAGGLTDASLTDDGRAQAEAVGRRLSGRDLAALYASPVVRAGETAQVIGEALGLEPQVLEGVRELDHGRWTDVSLEEMKETELFERVVRWPSRVSLPDGESFVVAQGRAVGAIEEVVAAHPDDATVGVVSHADVIKLLVAHYAGSPIDAFQRLIVSPGSVSVLSLPREGGPHVLAVNDTGHLPDRSGRGEGT